MIILCRNIMAFEEAMGEGLHKREKNLTENQTKVNTCNGRQQHCLLRQYTKWKICLMN